MLRSALLLFLLLSPPAHAMAGPAAGCDAFGWNLARELALLEAPGSQSAGDPRIAARAPRLDLDRHHALGLPRQAEVALAATPARPPRDAKARAGLFVFRVPAAGAYRVSLSRALWVEVVDDGGALPARAFQGRHGCASLRKSVVFDLEPGRDLLLQLDGGRDAEVGVVITGVPLDDR